MDKEKRKVLDKITEDMLDVMIDRYWRDDDGDRDLFLDVIMQWMFNTFGIGEILEYCSISLAPKSTDEEGLRNDMNRCVELIHEVLEALPPQDFQLFGEEAQPKEKERFASYFELNTMNPGDFMVNLRDDIKGIKNKRQAEFLADVVQLWVADVFSIAEDTEALKHRYGIKK